MLVKNAYNGLAEKIDQGMNSGNVLTGLLTILGLSAALVFVMFIIIFSVTWVFSDHRPCQAGHVEPYTYYVQSGSVMVPVTSEHFVCDSRG